MTNRAEFERLLDVYGFRCERFGQDLSTHARAQVVAAFAALASAPVAGEAQQGDNVAERLDNMADDQPPGSQAQSDLYAAATIWRKHIAHRAAPQASEAVGVEEAFAGIDRLVAVRDAALEEAAQALEKRAAESRNEYDHRKEPYFEGSADAYDVGAFVVRALKSRSAALSAQPGAQNDA